MPSGLRFTPQPPPLVSMLTDYLPLLPVRARIHGSLPFAPKTMTDAFKKGVQLRNKTAHAGEGVRSDTLKEILTAVHDLLYLLDVYAVRSGRGNRSPLKPNN